MQPRNTSTKHLDGKGAEIFFEHRVTEICLKDGKWEVCNSTGLLDQFDIVILTVPVPQILQLQGDIANILIDGLGLCLAFTPPY
uniref:Uncharacterized protein n=1 Tax=Sphaerodactylus townsendi TaxID=933632 RepID=A0ACB8F8G6_9SAUR